MIAIYADSNMNDVRVLHPVKMEFAFGEDENDFEVQMLPEGERLETLGYVYVEGTECGGIVTDFKNDIDDGRYVYSGMTWHGMLVAKVLQPDSGKDYLTVSGDVNAVLGMLINRIGLGAVMAAPSGSSGVTVSSYSFNRYCNAYEGICAMLATVGRTLDIKCQDGKAVLGTAATATRESPATTERHALPVNHLVCLGKGELAARTVVHLYADANGNVSRTQTLAGVNERAEVYDYSSAEESELVEKGTEKLKKLQVFKEAEMRDFGTDGMRIGDRLSAYDKATDVADVAAVTKKIVGFDSQMRMTVSFECGE